MFFFIFIFFSYKCFPANSLSCMTSRSILSTACTFSFGINDVIPDNKKLEESTTCQMGEGHLAILGAAAYGSCYAEVSIDYQTKRMNIKLTHVNVAQTFMDPYDDMFGFLSGIKSVIQYKINGNLEREEMEMVTRIQCDTYDDCAFDKLRTLLPNLTKPETRLTTFKTIATLLNTPDKDQKSDLQCMIDDNHAVNCSDDQNKCKYEHSKNVESAMSCVVPDPKEKHDIEYRFNVIEEMESGGSSTHEKGLKIVYLCKRNFCNDGHFIDQVLPFLYSFVFPSVVDSSNTNNESAASQSHKVKPMKSASNSASFYYQSMVIFFLFIQILSK